MPQTPLGELTRSSDPLAVFMGPLLRGRRGRGREDGRRREGKRKEGGEGKGREGIGEKRPYTPPVANSLLRHWTGSSSASVE